MFPQEKEDVFSVCQYFSAEGDCSLPPSPISSAAFGHVWRHCQLATISEWVENRDAARHRAMDRTPHTKASLVQNIDSAVTAKPSTCGAEGTLL